MKIVGHPLGGLFFMQKKFLFLSLTFLILFIPILAGLTYWGSLSSFDQDGVHLSPWGWPKEDRGYVLPTKYGEKYPIAPMLLEKFENPAAKNYLVLMGGSNTFGQGMEGERPAEILGKKLSETNIYNLSYPGWGPTNVLAALKAMDYSGKIKGERGYFLYQLPEYHIERACGSARTLEWNNGASPLYEVQGQFLIRKGFMRDHFSHFDLYYPLIGFYRGLKMVAGHARASWLMHYNSLQVSNCMKLIEMIFKDMKKEIDRIYPRAKFAVVMLPGFNWRYHIVKKYLVEKQFILFNPRHQIEEMEKLIGTDKLYQPDRHFTAQFYEELAPFYENIIKSYK